MTPALNARDKAALLLGQLMFKNIEQEARIEELMREIAEIRGALEMLLDPSKEEEENADE